MIFKILSSFGISDIFYILIISLIIHISRFYYRYFTRLNPLPGPFPLPFIGNAHQSIGLGFNDWLLSMYKEYGDIYEVDMGQRMIVVCRPDLIEGMNISSAKSKYPYRFKTTEGFIEYGLDKSALAFSDDLKTWKYNRQFFSKAIMTPSFNYQAIEWANELWKKMESYWNDLGENQELDLTKWIRRFTTDMTFRIATGAKNDSLTSYYNTFKNNDPLNEKEDEESERLIHSLEIFLCGVSYYMTFNKFMRHYVPFVRGKGKSLLKNRDYLYDKLNNIIKERRIEIDNTPLDQPLGHDMLTSCMTTNTPRDTSIAKHADDPLRPMTDKEIFGIILDAMLGGADTVSNLFCFVVYYLGHYPEVKQQFQQELDEVLGKGLTKPATYKDLEELRYCEAIIKEVTRHCPVSFQVGRINAEDDNVGGYNWPRGTSFQILYSAIMMRKDYWTDPEKFDPDRFYKVDESDKYLLEKKKDKNAFAIFGEGIRICPGRKLAMLELKCLLAMIYRKYDVELADINAPIKFKSAFHNSSEELIVKIKPRNF